MIRSEVDTLRLEVNDDGEYIMISADDATMFDRFAAGIRHIVELSDGTAKKVEEIEKQYEDLQSGKLGLKWCEGRNIGVRG